MVYAEFDAHGVITKIVKAAGFADDSSHHMAAARNMAAGRSMLQIDEKHNAATRPHRWKIVSGALAQKTQVTLKASGLTITATPAVDCAVRVGGRKVQLTNGAGTVTFKDAIPRGIILHVDPADPNYYSETTFT
jgi:leucyl aminopeptidase (aminopeptidase T)